MEINTSFILRAWHWIFVIAVVTILVVVGIFTFGVHSAVSEADFDNCYAKGGIVIVPNNGVLSSKRDTAKIHCFIDTSSS